MKDISFKDCVEFQDCFLFDGRFSPFESVGDFREYYPLVLMGEIGGLFNLSCKLVRTPNIYADEIEDECADIFIYLLLFGRMLEIHDKRQVLSSITSYWNQPIALFQAEAEFYDCCAEMLEKSLRFRNANKEQCFNEDYFRDFFLSLLQVSRYITDRSWQQIINKFHAKAIQKYTDPARFTLDGLYNGSFRININKLLAFIDDIGIQLPEKRIDFLRRMDELQSVYFYEAESKIDDRSAMAANFKCSPRD